MIAGSSATARILHRPCELILGPEGSANADAFVAQSAGGRDTDGTTIFVKGFSREFGGEEEVRQALTEAFADCGEVSQVCLPAFLPMLFCACLSLRFPCGKLCSVCIVLHSRCSLSAVAAVRCLSNNLCAAG